MKTIIAFLGILFVFILGDCKSGQNEKESGSLNDTTNGIDYSKIIKDSLRGYLSVGELDTIVLCIDKYNSIKSSKDLADFYYTTDPKLFEIIFSINADGNFTDDKSVKNGFDFISKFLPCIALETVDGLLGYGYIDMAILSKKAKETPEPDDDLFVEADISKYYDSWNGNYFSEYVGAGNAISILGNDTVFSAIDRILKARKSGTHFQQTLDKNVYIIFKEIDTDSYFESKKDVMKELEKIEKLEFTETERQKLNQIKQKIINKPNNSFNVTE